MSQLLVTLFTNHKFIQICVLFAVLTTINTDGHIVPVRFSVALTRTIVRVVISTTSTIALFDTGSIILAGTHRAFVPRIIKKGC